MATYLELYNLSSNSVFRSRIRVACIVAAESIRVDQGPPQTEKLEWAADTMRDPKTEAERMVWAVLASSKGYTPEQILSASDSAIQIAVDAAVDLFAEHGTL
jgi:hypothetical protein